MDNILVPTTTSLLSSTTLATSTATSTVFSKLSDHLLLKIILNSSGLKHLIYALAAVAIIWIFKDSISKFIKSIKKIFIRTKGKQVIVDISDHGDIDPKLALIESEAPSDSSNNKLEEKNAYPISIDDWRLEMYISFWKKNFEKAEEAYKKVQDLETDSKKRKINKITYLRELYCYKGDGEAFKDIENMLADIEVKANIHMALGRCHEHGQNFNDAANEFLKAAASFKTDEEMVDAKIRASYNIEKTGRFEESVDLLIKSLKDVSKKELMKQIYVALASLYEKIDDNEMRTILFEKALKLTPNDKDLLFKAGYASSELPKWYAGLSLLHYRNAVKFGSEDEAVFNNIGVQYERLGMPIKSVRYYKESIEKQGTLSAANLAYKYLNVGFVEEAKRIIDEHKDKEDVHKNVAEANFAISERKEEEDKKEREIMIQAERLQEFIATFAEHYFSTEGIIDYSGEWKFEDGTTVNIIQDINRKLVGKWVSNRKRMFSGQLKNSAIKVVNYRVLYSRLLGVSNDENEYLPDGIGYIYFKNDNLMKMVLISESGTNYFNAHRLVPSLV